MDYSAEIGRNIVTIRNSRGITQRELAEKAGMSVSRLRDVEHGRANSSVNMLLRISNALHVHPLTIIMLSFSPKEIKQILRQMKEF